MKQSNDSGFQELAQAFTLLKDRKEVERFLYDLCTPQELQAFTERWQIAKALDKGEMSYRDISASIGASTTTVARVARFLRQENYQGYQLVLNRLSNKKAA